MMDEWTITCESNGGHDVTIAIHLGKFTLSAGNDSVLDMTVSFRIS